MKCLTLGCNNKARFDGYCSDQCMKDDYEEELGYQRISRALSHCVDPTSQKGEK